MVVGVFVTMVGVAVSIMVGVVVVGVVIVETVSMLVQNGCCGGSWRVGGVGSVGIGVAVLMMVSRAVPAMTYIPMW